MAIYHLSLKMIGRSSGQSIFAAAAYRSATRLIDKGTQEIHDYRKKMDVLFHKIYLPTVAPSVLTNMEVLYSALEASTTRKDGVYSREIECSLPRELTFEQNVYLLVSFVGWFTGQGMVVQANIHGGTDGENPHIHLLAPVREVHEDGTFGRVNRNWGQRSFLTLMRKVWADRVNYSLAEAGHAQRVSHRSLEEQGITRKPTAHVGAKVTAMARSGNPWAIRLAKAKRERINEHAEIRNRFHQQTVTKLRRGWFEPVPEGAIDFRPCAVGSPICVPGRVGESDSRGLAS